MTTPRYIVMESSAHSPAGKAWRGYRNLALVRLEPGFGGRPKMISPRARGLDEVIDYHHSVHVGATDRSAGVRLRAELQARADALNAQT